jgi:MFS family permease
VRLLRQRDFLLLFVSYGLSSLGDYLALLALTIRVHDLTSSGWAVAGLLLTGLVPLVVFAPLAGLMVDRFETVRLLAVTGLLQAGVAAGLAFAGTLPLIYSLSFLLGTGFAVTQPGLFALVPKVAGEEHVTAANANMEVARWGGATLGPLVGGAIAAGFGTRAALLADAASFAIVAAATMALRVRRPAEIQAGERQPREARQGVALIARDRLLRLVAGVLAAVVLFAAMDNVAEVFFAKDVLDAGDAGYGGLVGAWTLGMVLGSTLIARRIQANRLASTLLLAAVTGGSAVVLAAAIPTLPLALAAFMVGGVSNGVVNVSMRSLIHHRVPDRLRGRVFAAFYGLLTSAQITAMGLGGGLVALAGGRGSLLVAGAGGALAGLGGVVLYATLPAKDRSLAEPAGVAAGSSETVPDET